MTGREYLAAVERGKANGAREQLEYLKNFVGGSEGKLAQYITSEDVLKEISYHLAALR
jgi:hypothetical protein